MAKDGTLRGGSRAGAGRKQKALLEKIQTGNPGGRPLKVLDLPEQGDLTGSDMPPVREYLKAKQKNGKDFCAAEVYELTWKWLKGCGCEKLVLPILLEQYSMAVARWIQCEECITEYGQLAKHPTTGNPITSPYVTMSIAYSKQVTQLYYQINQIVKENCSIEYGGPSPEDDLMERLLRAREGKR